MKQQLKQTILSVDAVNLNVRENLPTCFCPIYKMKFASNVYHVFFAQRRKINSLLTYRYNFMTVFIGCSFCFLVDNSNNSATKQSFQNFNLIEPILYSPIYCALLCVQTDPMA